MGRAGITYTEVVNAAMQLQGQQKAPTVENIRRIIGTGSNSTIAKLLREWKEKQGIESQAEGSIPAELLALVKGLWQHLQEKTDQRMSEHQQTTDKQLQASQQQLNEAGQQHRQLQQLLQQKEEVLQQQTQACQALQNQRADEGKAHAKQQERAAMLEQQLTQQTAETGRLHQLLKQVQTNLEHYQAAIKLSEKNNL